MPDAFEQELALADVYAAALFSLAREAGTVAETRSELEELVKLEEREPSFARFMRSGAVDDDRRRASLETMFRDRLSDVVLNTLCVMNAHGRAGVLPALLRAFVLREEHAEGQVEVTATSAVPLNDTEQAAVKKWAAEVSGQAPLVEYVVDPAIGGGLIVQIGDYRFDHSVRRHLKVARSQLLARSDRGLPAAASE